MLAFQLSGGDDHMGPGLWGAAANDDAEAD